MVTRSNSSEKITGFHSSTSQQAAVDEWPEKKRGRFGKLLFMVVVMLLFSALALLVLYFRFPGLWEALSHAKWYSFLLAGFSLWMYMRGESFFS